MQYCLTFPNGSRDSLISFPAVQLEKLSRSTGIFKQTSPMVPPFPYLATMDPRPLHWNYSLAVAEMSPASFLKPFSASASSPTPNPKPGANSSFSEHVRQRRRSRPRLSSSRGPQTPPPLPRLPRFRTRLPSPNCPRPIRPGLHHLQT